MLQFCVSDVSFSNFRVTILAEDFRGFVQSV
jgi:hypothetical protein